MGPRKDPVLQAIIKLVYYFFRLPIIGSEEILNHIRVTLQFKIKDGNMACTNSSLRQSDSTGWYCSKWVGWSSEKKKMATAIFSFFIYYCTSFSWMSLIDCLYIHLQYASKLIHNAISRISLWKSSCQYFLATIMKCSGSATIGFIFIYLWRLL